MNDCSLDCLAKEACLMDCDESSRHMGVCVYAAERFTYDIVHKKFPSLCLHSCPLQKLFIASYKILLSLQNCFQNCCIDHSSRSYQSTVQRADMFNTAVRVVLLSRSFALIETAKPSLPFAL